MCSLPTNVQLLFGSSQPWTQLHSFWAVLSPVFEKRWSIRGCFTTTLYNMQQSKVIFQLLVFCCVCVLIHDVKYRNFNAFFSFQCSTCDRVFNTGRARSAHLCCKRMRDETSTRSSLGFSMVTLPTNAATGVSETILNEQERIVDILRYSQHCFHYLGSKVPT